MHTFYEDYKQCLQEAGVCFLENQSAELTIRGQKLVIHGLELHLDYKRTRHNQLDVKVINTLLGKCSQDAYHILLAHSPKFWKCLCQLGRRSDFVWSLSWWLSAYRKTRCDKSVSGTFFRLILMGSLMWESGI